jgi:DNA polymerase-1
VITADCGGNISVGFMSVIEFFDIETDGLSVDATTVWCIGISELNQEGVDVYGPDEISQALDRLGRADVCVGHNICQFDCPCLKHLWGWDSPPRLDTLVCARLMYPDRYTSPVGGNSLGEWGEYLKFPKGGHTDFTHYSEEMAEYCGNDVLLCKEIYKYLRKRWSKWKTAIQLEHEVSDIIAHMTWNGVSINTKAATKLYELANAERVPLLERLQEAFPPREEVMKTPEYYYVHVDDMEHQFDTKGSAKEWLKQNKVKAEVLDGPMRIKYHPFLPSSGDQIAERFIAKYNWKPKVFTKSGKACTDGDVLSKLALKYGEAQWIIDWRMTQQRAELAQTWMAAVSPVTGRLHHSVNTNGAVTGRMSHSDPNVNCPKIRKGKNKEILYGFEGEYGYECRACFEPRPGWWQVGADASGLELRMLAHYMARYDDGEYIKVLLEGDIHEFNRVAAGLETRDMAKTFIYAFLYGAGDEKIGKIVNGSAKDGAALKSKFLRSLSALAQLKAWVEECVERGFVTGLDGRIVPIRSKHAALNTVLQGGGALVMKKACVIRYNEINKLYDYGTQWADILNVHDEFQSETADKKIAKRVGELSVQAIKKSGEHFELACPLDGEYKIGKNWAECH